jgi:transposase
MYIRKSQQKHTKTGEVYSSYRLVASYRNAEGKVRQETLFNLGSQFSIPQTEWKTLVRRIEEIQRGQCSLFSLDHCLEKEAERIAKLLIRKSSEQSSPTPVRVEHPTNYQSVDVNSLEHNDVRKIGAEHVALQAAKQIKLDEILLSLGFTQRQQEIALASIIGRLVHPGSELNTYRYLTRDSALDELLGTDFSDIGLQNLYKISDQLLKHKETIECRLYQHEKDIFQFNEIITLYDLTNTYFEGQRSQSLKKQYGRSKEKRSDCCIVSLGMVLDASGFPKKSKIYPGNVSEPKTLAEMLSMLSDNKESIVVMDAGIATEENITWLKSEGYRYIVVSRKRNLVMPPDHDAIILKESKINQVEATLVSNDETNELELYCHSQAKEAKTKMMLSKASQRYEEELKKLAQGLRKKRGTKKYEKIMERIGRLKEKYSKVGQLYEIYIESNEERTLVTEITWERNEEKASTKQAGIYCLRTNQKDLDAQTLWEVYTTLTDLESAFRSLKSELGLRPIYHQIEPRIDGHLFISIVAYHLLHTIRYQLKHQGINANWQTLREVLETHSRITSTLKLESGGIVKIRKTTSPNADQLAIYNALRIESRPAKTETAYL